MKPKNWKPSWLVATSDGAFRVQQSAAFGGSLHILELQKKCYLPLIQQHIHGHLLDCGCGKVPYLEVYEKKITQLTLLDVQAAGEVELDCTSDLNQSLPFADGVFDSILLTDVIAHVYKQRALFSELVRVLKPGGTLLLTTPYNYWMAAPPHEYGRPSEYTLRAWCAEEDVVVSALESYGGHGDVLLDCWNKKWSSGIFLKAFQLLAFLLKKSPNWKKHNEKTKYSYPLGYALVAQKRKA
jgi:SAM-dependent methyltransferase